MNTVTEGGEQGPGKSKSINVLLALSTPFDYPPGTPNPDIPGGVILEKKEPDAMAQMTRPITFSLAQQVSNERKVFTMLPEAYKNSKKYGRLVSDEMDANQNQLRLGFLLDKVDSKIEVNIRWGQKWWMEVECFSELELKSEIEVIRERWVMGSSEEREDVKQFLVDHGMAEDAAVDPNDKIEVHIDVKDQRFLGRTVAYVPGWMNAQQDRLYLRELLAQLSMRSDSRHRSPHLMSLGVIKRIVVYAPSKLLTKEIQWVEASEYNSGFRRRTDALIKNSRGAIMFSVRDNNELAYDTFGAVIQPVISAHNYDYPFGYFVVVEHATSEFSQPQVTATRTPSIKMIYQKLPKKDLDPDAIMVLKQWVNKVVQVVAPVSYLSLLSLGAQRFKIVDDKVVYEDQELSTALKMSGGRELVDLALNFRNRFGGSAETIESERKRVRPTVSSSSSSSKEAAASETPSRGRKGEWTLADQLEEEFHSLAYRYARMVI
jgi:hypothetical protein